MPVLLEVLGRQTLVLSNGFLIRRTTRVRRVLFNVPGSDEKKIMKATTLDLDCVVLDLEDGVAPNKKEVVLFAHSSGAFA